MTNTKTITLSKDLAEKAKNEKNFSKLIDRLLRAYYGLESKGSPGDVKSPDLRSKGDLNGETNSNDFDVDLS